MKKTLPMKRKQEIGERVRAIRKSLRLEQTDLAKEMGISQAIISQYEKGMTEIPLSFLEYLKKKHGVSSDWVIFGTGEMKAAIKKNLDGTQDKFLKLIKQTLKSLGGRSPLSDTFRYREGGESGRGHVPELSGSRCPLVRVSGLRSKLVAGSGSGRIAIRSKTTKDLISS